MALGAKWLLGMGHPRGLLVMAFLEETLTFKPLCPTRTPSLKKEVISDGKAWMIAEFGLGEVRVQDFCSGVDVGASTSRGI